MTGPVDPRCCPRCGRDNACGIAAGGSRCWCMERTATDQAADDLLACYCADCLDAETVPESPDDPRRDSR